MFPLPGRHHAKMRRSAGSSMFVPSAWASTPRASAPKLDGSPPCRLLHYFRCFTVRVLSRCSGETRNGGLKHWLEECSPPLQCSFSLLEVDASRDEVAHFEAGQAKMLALAPKYYVVVSTPPCSTHSRAVWSNKLGPCPVRSAQLPM